MDEPTEAEAVEALGRLGLSTYEAQVFIALQKLGVATASEVDRVAEVPRSQVYGAAERLEERGLVEVQQTSPIRYRAVDPADARALLEERLARDRDRAVGYLERAREEAEDPGETQEGVWRVVGQSNVSARVVTLIEEADHQVVNGTRAELLDDAQVEALAAAADRCAVLVASVDAAVSERLADVEGVTVREIPPALDQFDRAGRFCIVDGDTVLLSVDGDGVAGPAEETAIWSAGTGIATVLVQLLDGWFGTLLRVEDA